MTTPTLTKEAWLTAGRLRAHALIIAVCLWTSFGWNLATPGLRDRSGNLKGTDFLHFYTLGIIAAQHRGSELYDMNAQAALAAARVPQAAGIRYLPLYPPQVSMLFAPLSLLSYGWALTVWWLLGTFLYGVSCYAIWRVCPNLRGYGGTVVLAALGFPAFFHLIVWGQSSALALACFTGMFLLLQAKREFLAGLVLGCLVVKPQLGIAAAAVFVCIGAWQIVLGAIASALAQLLIGATYYGVEPLRQWIHTLHNITSVLPWFEPRPYQTHSLRTFWTMLVPSNSVAFGLYLATAALILGFAIALWKRGNEVALGVRFSCLLLATVLAAPHLTVYDLVILAPALLLMANWILTHQQSAESVGTLLYLVYVLPLLGPMARWTHVQLSVLAMAAAVYTLWKVRDRQAPVPTPAASLL